jgi:cardiolipin synthase A/B
MNTVARCSMPRPSPSTAGGPAWGSANLDRRSFALNHELNIACDDPDVARRLERIYAEDLQYAHEVTLEEWRSRGIGRLFELFVLPLRDQL